MKQSKLSSKLKNKMYLSIFLFSTLILNAQFKSSEIIKLEVQRLNDSYIDVYITKNVSKKKKPILLFCQGSGSESSPESKLAIVKLLPLEAIGLYVEKQGVEYGDNGDSISLEYKNHNTIDNRLYDYLRTLQYLKSNNIENWNGDLYVIGGSEGGLMAGLIASFYPNTKGVAILSYGGGLKFEEAWPITTKLILTNRQITDTNIVNTAVNLVKDTLKKIILNPTISKSYSGIDNTYLWWNSVSNKRIINSLLDINVPVFIGHGENDIMAPPESAIIVTDNFSKNGKKNLRFKLYKDYDHSFTDSQGKSHKVEVIIDALNWIFKKEGK